MQTQKPEVWNRDVKAEMSLSLSDVQCSNATILLWRGIILKINIGYQTGHHGWPSFANFKFLISDTFYTYRVTTSNITFVKEHKISNGTHFLYFFMSGKSLLLKQEAVHKKFADSETVGSPFEIILCQNGEYHLRPPFEVIEDPYKVTLFEDSNSDRSIKSEACYLKEDLEVDNWEMGRKGYYEDEYYIIVRKKNLHFLFGVFNIPNEDKIALFASHIKSI